MMENELSLDLILQSEVQKLLDNFASVIRAHVSFFGAGGELLRQGRGEGNCRFCQLIQKKMSVKLCRQLDTEKQLQAKSAGCCQTYLCHAGLWEAVMPVRTGGELLGYVMFGQFRKSTVLPVQLKNIFRTESELKEISAAFQELPEMSAEAMENLTGLMKLLVDYIVRNELVTYGRGYLFSAVESYIDMHLTKDVTLSETARHLGRSVSSLAHFLASRHTTFKKILIGKRIQLAEKLLKEHPEMSIKEISGLSGFQDPYYFSRTYRKHRGCTPGEFRRKQQCLL